MADSPSSIGARPGGLAALAKTLGIGTTPSQGGTAARTGGGSTRAPSSGPRGMRMLSPDYPVDQLDRSAPRGTYIDILV